jgi:hypothetical protein
MLQIVNGTDTLGTRTFKIRVVALPVLLEPKVYHKFKYAATINFLLDSPADNASGGQEPFCKRVPGPPKTFYQVLFLVLSLSASSRVFAVYKNRRWI